MVKKLTNFTSKTSSSTNNVTISDISSSIAIAPLRGDIVLFTLYNGFVMNESDIKL